MEENKILRYIAFTSSVNPGFWKTLTEIKLDVDKLNEERKPIWGKYTNYGLPNSTNIYFEVDSTSFNGECNYQNFDLPVRGFLMNKNIIEDFKKCDKRGMLHDFSQEIVDSWKKEDPFGDPSLLNNFILLSFADLKSFKYYYWFAFPSPLLSVNINVNKVSLMHEVFPQDFVSNLYCTYEKLTVQQKTFFILKSNKITPLSDIKSLDSDSNLDDYYFVFSDPSKSLEHPGWPLNNYIAFILYHCPFLYGKELKFLAWRLSLEQLKFTCKHSLVFTVIVPECNIKEWIGWERNKSGKLLPQLASMKNSMDPKHLAEAAVDLNLRLMKWRLSPDLNLDKIRRAKCLVLGAGSLGWSVALTLLGWGVRHIRFVDGALDDDISKAERAAENLKKIFPGVASQGYKLIIPVPGSPPASESQISQTKEAVDGLVDLLCEHDVIFLSLGSKESRWLPTFLSSYYNKMTINLAKGPHSYHVMRQGVNILLDFKEAEASESQIIPSDQLSCYFCTEEIIRSENLNEPFYGISEIAGALATELAISILQHPQGAAAPAKSNQNIDDGAADNDCILGNLPHSMWGFLSDFNDQTFSVTRKHSQCIACSETVKNEYKSNGFEFLLKGFASFEYLNTLTQSCFKFPILDEINKYNLAAIPEKVRQAKCLLLGSGTLGCSVATTLSGWGVSHITFVDNSNVSYSNPVRQNLFTFENCTQNKSKAEAAAENLKKLFPHIETKGYKLTIPMPGHQVGETLLGEIRQNVETLVNLICDHDVVFLLMDSRESRWLPTLLGSYHKKIVINAALGFDSYLVMRHGITLPGVPEGESSSGYTVVPGKMLGCYFCNDITAPGNSMQSRTLDQQCTVTRPGVSKIAGSLASLLAVSILQHPKGFSAPACYKSNMNVPDLGGPDKDKIRSLPHSIRGYLANFTHIFPATKKYTRCVACSEFVTNEYAENGFEFLLKAFDSRKYLETITGIFEMCENMPSLDDLEFDFDA